MLKKSIPSSLLAIILTCTLLFSLLPSQVLASGDKGILATGTCGGDGDGSNLTWVLTEDGCLTISGQGAMADFEYDTMPWYSYQSEVLSAVVEEGVTSLGVYTFRDCSLEEVSLPSTLTSIGNWAFTGCNSLTSISIPAEVTSIGEQAFYECRKLERIIVPSENTTYIGGDVLYIPNGTFLWCSELKTGTYTVPNGISTIAKFAFHNSALSEIILPDSLISIEERAFDWASIQSINIPEGITEISSEAFYVCENLIDVSLPESLTTIQTSAFQACSSLKYIYIPKGVTQIASLAFSGCSQLETIDVAPENPIYIGGDMLYIPNNTLLWGSPLLEGECIIPDGITTIAFDAFGYCINITKVSLPSSLIHFDGFRGCSSLTSIVLPDRVTTIDSFALNDCTTLASITIPTSVTRINNWAFDGCSSLTDVYYAGTDAQWSNLSISTNGNDPLFDAALHTATAPALTGTCGKNVSWTLTSDNELIISGQGIMDDFSNYPPWYSYADQIKSITIESGVTNIGKRAFYGCDALSMTISESVSSIGDEAFYACYELQEIIVDEANPYFIGGNTLYSPNDTFLWLPQDTKGTFVVPDGITRIGPWAFNCCEVSEIVLPDTLTTIDPWAINYCGNLIKINIPSGVTSIGNDAFHNCHNLQEISLPDTLVSIGNNAFDACGFSSITIPQNVTHIGSGAFRVCRNLEEIIITDGNPNFTGGEALYNSDGKFLWCSPMVEGKYEPPEEITSIEADAFSGCNLAEIILPNSITSIGQDAFSFCSNLSSIVIPNSVQSIDAYAFSYCPNLTSVLLPQSLSSVKWCAFDGCSSLSNVFFTGTPNEWELLCIDTFGNDALLNSSLHFNAVALATEDSANGTISLSSPYASKGNTITVTATPDEGYALTQLLVNGVEQEDLTSFVVPDADTVTITATFSPAVSAEMEHSKDGTPVSVTIETGLPGYAMVAFYDENGRMVDIAMAPITPGTNTVDLSGLEGDLANCTWKLLVTDEGYSPLCEAFAP